MTSLSGSLTIKEVTRNADATIDAFEDLGILGRAELLDQISDAISRNAQELAEIADGETGLGLTRTLSEAARTARQFALMAEVLRDGAVLRATIDAGRASDDPRGAQPDIRRGVTAIGVVGVFAASNFPLAFGVAGTDTAAALAAGCPVVAKAHSLQPRTAEAGARIIRQCVHELGLPSAVFTLVSGREAGRELDDMSSGLTS